MRVPRFRRPYAGANRNVPIAPDARGRGPAASPVTAVRTRGKGRVLASRHPPERRVHQHTGRAQALRCRGAGRCRACLSAWARRCPACADRSRRRPRIWKCATRSPSSSPRRSARESGHGSRRSGHRAISCRPNRQQPRPTNLSRLSRAALCARRSLLTIAHRGAAVRTSSKRPGTRCSSEQAAAPVRCRPAHTRTGTWTCESSPACASGMAAPAPAPRYLRCHSAMVRAPCTPWGTKTLPAMTALRAATAAATPTRAERGCAR